MDKFVSVFHFVIFYYPLELWNEMEFIFYTVPALGPTEDFSNVEHKVTVCHWAGAISSKSISESIYNWFFYPAVRKKPTNCRSALDPLLLDSCWNKRCIREIPYQNSCCYSCDFQSQWGFISPASPQQRICSFCHSCQWQFITSYFLSWIPLPKFILLLIHGFQQQLRNTITGDERLLDKNCFLFHLKR